MFITTPYSAYTILKRARVTIQILCNYINEGVLSFVIIFYYIIQFHYIPNTKIGSLFQLYHAQRCPIRICEPIPRMCSRVECLAMTTIITLSG